MHHVQLVMDLHLLIAFYVMILLYSNKVEYANQNVMMVIIRTLRKCARSVMNIVELALLNSILIVVPVLLVTSYSLDLLNA